MSDSLQPWGGESHEVAAARLSRSEMERMIGVVAIDRNQDIARRREQMRKLLGQLPYLKSRAALLESRLRRAEEAQALLSDAGIASGQLPAWGLDGMPRGAGPQASRVERAAEARERAQADAMEETARLKRELAWLNGQVYELELALRALPDMPRMVLERHIIEGKSWTEVQDALDRDQRYYLGRTTLRRYMMQGFDLLLELIA